MSEKDKNSLPLIFLIFLAIIFVAAGFAIYQYWNYFCNGHISCSLLAPTENNSSLINNLAYWGQTGDFFGGILNPFLTFIGLIFVVITIKQNQTALKQSKKELKLSRKELKKSSNALKEQVKTAELQRFETTFFNLLSLFNKTVSDVFYLEKSQGRQAIVTLYRNQLSPLIPNNKTSTSEIILAYGKFRNSKGYLLDSYFCNFYNVIDFVDNSNFSEKEKRYYINLVSSQLSLHELCLLFYFCFLPIEYEYNKLSTLIKKYPILKNLDKKALVSETHSELLEYAKD